MSSYAPTSSYDYYTFILKSDDNTAVYDPITKFTTFTLNYPIPRPYGNKFALEIMNAAIPYTFYNVNSYNNTFYVIEGGNPARLISIPYGFYSAVNIIPVVIALLNNNSYGLTYSLTYSSITKLFTFTLVGGLSVTIFTAGSLAIDLFGFITPTALSSVLPAVAVDVADFLYTNVMLVACNLVSDKCISSADMKPDNILAMIPLNVPVGNVCYKLSSSPCHIMAFFVDNFTTISIDIRDDEQRHLNFNGASWELEIRLHMFIPLTALRDERGKLFEVTATPTQ